MATLPSHPSRLIGRDREHQSLLRAFQRAAACDGSAVLVSGEAGIGKTTLVQQFVHQAREHGAEVISGGCYDLTTTPPYGPWSDAIRGYLPFHGSPAIPSWLGNSEEIEQATNQAALFEGARRFFADIAKDQPLVIVLEDLHWADPGSIDALRYLARSLRETGILIVATYRDDEPYPNEALERALPALVREARTERIRLQRWQSSETRSLVVSRYRLDEDAENRLANHLHCHAEGNPFFTGELLQELEVDSILQPADGGWVVGELGQPGVPRLVRQVLERRMAGLSSDSRSLLDLASVIGHEVPFDLWRTVGECDDEALDAAVEEAERSHFIDVLPDLTGVRFRHALIRETLYSGIGPISLRSKHLQVAEALSGRPTSDPDAVAYHFEKANDDRAAYWLVRAGMRARQATAWISAADRFRRASDVLAHQEGHARARGWLLYYASSLQRFTNDPQSISYLDKAEHLARETGDDLLLAYIEGTRGTLSTIRGDVRTGIACLEKSTRLFECFGDVYLATTNFQAPAVIEQLLLDDEGPLYPSATGKSCAGVGTFRSHPFHGVYSNWLGMSGRYEKALVVGRDYERGMVERHGAEFHLHADGSYSGLFGLGHSRAGLGRPDPARDAYQRAGESAERFHDYTMMSYSAFLALIHVVIPFYANEPDYRRQLVAYSNGAWKRAADMSSVASGTPQAQIVVDVLDGSWKRAWRTVQEEIDRLGPLATVGTFHYSFAILARYMGKTEIAWSQVRKRLPDGPSTKPGNSFFLESTGLQRLAVDLALDAGDLRIARDWLEAHDRWLQWSGGVLGRAESHLLWARHHLRNGDERASREEAQHALACASNPRQPLALIVVHRFLGELETQAGTIDASHQHFATALKYAEACQAPYEIALTQLAQVNLAIKMQDIDAAQRSLPLARATFQRLEAKPALTRLDRLASRLESRSPSNSSGLTPREVEVLHLVADGLSNREIAEHLYLSVRTVERHIANIYAKINVSNRVAASSYAQQHLDSE